MTRLNLLFMITAVVFFACPLIPPTEAGENNLKITGLGWVSENIDPHFWTPPSDWVNRSFYDFWVYYEGELSLGDLSEVIVKDLDSDTWWTIPLNEMTFDPEEKTIGGWLRFYDQASPTQLPIGKVSVQINLKNGRSVSYEASIPAPGDAQAGAWTHMHTEDFNGTDASSSSMVKRAVLNSNLLLNNQKYTAVLNFSTTDPKAYDGNIWFFTEAGKLVGASPNFRDLPSEGTSSLPSGLKTDGGSNLVTVSVEDMILARDMSFTDIGKAVVVLTDGAQYADETDETRYDCRSISSWAEAVTAPVIYPESRAGADQNGYVGIPVTLQGEALQSENPSYSWTVAAVPKGSAAALSDLTAAMPSFTPDVSGVYRFSLKVTSGDMTSSADEVSVYVSRRRLTDLPSNIVEAEYDPVHERIVLVSTAPPKVTLLDPVEGTSFSADLPYPPTCSGLSADGNMLAVGHNGYVSVVDVSTEAPSFKNSWILSAGGGHGGGTGADLIGVAYSNTGYIYCFPTADQWVDLRIVHAGSGMNYFNSLFGLYAGSLAKLAPSGNSVYYFTKDISPSDLHWIDFTSPPPDPHKYLDSRYHGDYPIGGSALWFDESYHVIVGAGSIFTATESGSAATDMEYIGTLSGLTGGRSLKSFSHRTAASWGGKSSLYALIPEVSVYESNRKDQTKVVLASSSDFSEVEVLPLPLYFQNSTSTPAIGYEVWWNKAGTELYVLTKSDGAADASDWDLVVY